VKNLLKVTSGSLLIYTKINFVVQTVSCEVSGFRHGEVSETCIIYRELKFSKWKDNTIKDVEMSVAVNIAQQQIFQNSLFVLVMQEGQQCFTERQTVVTSRITHICPTTPSQY
jgi:hypothetical protein